MSGHDPEAALPEDGTVQSTAAVEEAEVPVQRTPQMPPLWGSGSSGPKWIGYPTRMLPISRNDGYVLTVLSAFSSSSKDQLSQGDVRRVAPSICANPVLCDRQDGR